MAALAAQLARRVGSLRLQLSSAVQSTLNRMHDRCRMHVVGTRDLQVPYRTCPDGDALEYYLSRAGHCRLVRRLERVPVGSSWPAGPMGLEEAGRLHPEHQGTEPQEPGHQALRRTEVHPRQHYRPATRHRVSPGPQRRHGGSGFQWSGGDGGSCSAGQKAISFVGYLASCSKASDAVPWPCGPG